MRVAILLCTLLAAAPGWAQDAPDREAYEAARRDWSRCGERLSARFPSFPGTEDYWRHFEVRRDGSAWRIQDDELGNGVEAQHGGRTIRFTPRRCTTSTVRWSAYDGALYEEIRAGAEGAPTPSAADVASLAGAEVARPDNPAHGAARAWIGQRCPRTLEGDWPSSPDRAWDVVGPLVEEQPWLAGRPRAAPRTYWTRDMLSALGSTFRLQGTDAPDGIAVPAMRPAARAHSGGPSEIWTAQLPGRNGGVAVAVYDPARDRHRWIALTRGCVNGTSIDFVARDGDLVIGQSLSRHPVYAENDAVVLIDLGRGTAWVVTLRGASRVDYDDDGEPVPLLERAPRGVRLRSGNRSLVVRFDALRRRLRARGRPRRE